jgi:hypothetical protein
MRCLKCNSVWVRLRKKKPGYKCCSCGSTLIVVDGPVSADTLPDASAKVDILIGTLRRGDYYSRGFDSGDWRPWGPFGPLG